MTKLRFRENAECPNCNEVYKVEDFNSCPNSNCEINPDGREDENK